MTALHEPAGQLLETADRPCAGGGGPVSRIVVPVRDPKAAAGALTVAADLAVAVGGMIRVVHVRAYSPPMRGYGRFYTETSAEATALIEQALTSAWASGAKASGIVTDAERPQVAEAIIKAAADWDAGLIVVTRRHRAALSRLLLGSITTTVLGHASCPVLVVRSGKS